MLRLLALVAVFAVALPACTQAEAPKKQAQQSRFTADSTIDELLNDPAARAVIDRHLPALATHPQLWMIRDWSLRRLATDPHARGLDEKKVAEIEADLALIK